MAKGGSRAPACSLLYSQQRVGHPSISEMDNFRIKKCPRRARSKAFSSLGAAENLSREFQRTPSRPRHCFESVRGREPTRGASAGCFPPGYSSSHGVGAARAAGGMLTARGITEVTTEQQPWDFFTRNRGNCSFLRCAACILRG